MRNRYPGTCYRCGKRVEKGEGHFERDRATRSWRTQHAACAIKYRGTEVGRAKAAPIPPPKKERPDGK